MTAVTESVHTTAFATDLDACHDKAAPGGVVVSARGWVIASAERVDGDPVPGGWTELSCARHGNPSPPAVRLAFARELVALQRRTLAELLDLAVTRLEQRSSEGSNLLNRQLVRGSVADVALGLSEADDLSRLDPQARRAWLVHRDLVACGRTMVKLFGASGFLDDRPGRLVHLLELVGNTYLHPGEADA